MTQQLRFSSLSKRSGPVLWSQKSMWNNLQRIAPDDLHLNQVVTLALRQPVTLGHVSDALREVLRRHESLRTTYPLDLEGNPTQEVWASGDIPIYLHSDTGTSKSWYTEVLRRHFDVANQLPIRVALATQGEMVSQVALCLSHISTDAYSNQILREELSGLLSSSPAVLGQLPPQPIDLAVAQQEESTKGRYDKTYSYWRKLMAVVPVPPLDVEPVPPASPRYWHGLYASRRMDEASQLLAEQSRLSESAIVLAAILRGLAGYIRNVRFPLWLRFSNRFKPEVQRTVGYLCQNVPLLIDLDLSSKLLTFADSIEKSIMRAYRHSEYDPDLVKSLLPGGGRYSAMSYNTQPRPKVSPLQVDGFFEWIDKFENENILLYANCFLGRGVSMIADTAILSPAQLESCLRQVECFLVDEANQVRQDAV